MKSNGTTTILNWALMVGTVLLLVGGIKYYNKSKAVRSGQILLADFTRLQTAQNVAAGLLNETIEYSKTHPAIDPTLEAIGAKPSKTAPIAAPATKPAKQVLFMSDVNENPAPGSTEVGELKKTCAELQAQTYTLRIVLLLVVGALCLFFWREAGFNDRIAQQMQPQVIQAAQFVEALSKQGTSMEKQLQVLQSAVSRLVDYARSHPDYVPILNKYGVPVTTASTSAPAPAGAGSPAPPKK